MPETYTSGVWLAKAGEEAEFIAAWQEFVIWAKTMPGCGTFRLVRDLEEPSRFMSFAPRESFEAQCAWKEDPEFREQIMRARRHTDDFTPATFELVTQVD